MVVTKVIVTNGVRREFDVSLPPSGIARVLRIRGDITNEEEVKEAMQELAILLGVEKLKG